MRLGNYVAYSKICTHAGCPASLYEQQTNRLLCPCHQSQFAVTDNAQPIFGPATPPLPKLPIDRGRGGILRRDVATSWSRSARPSGSGHERRPRRRTEPAEGIDLAQPPAATGRAATSGSTRRHAAAPAC